MAAAVTDSDFLSVMSAGFRNHRFARSADQQIEISAPAAEISYCAYCLPLASRGGLEGAQGSADVLQRRGLLPAPVIADTFTEAEAAQMLQQHAAAMYRWCDGLQS
jgi:hypothetical protein